MYNQNAQNSLLRIRTELNECSYSPNMKDYLSNLIMSVMNFPKKANQPRHYIRNMGPDKIIMIWYSMSVPFAGRSYNVPLLIYITKNIPYDPPQIFLEVPQGSGINTKNTDINPNSRRILTNSLRNWNQYSIIDNAMNEIFDSFSRTFPIYKKSANDQNQQQQQQGTGGGGGIYNMMKNEVSNLYQQVNNNNNNNNYYNQGKPNIYGYKPPAQNIYGKPMSNNNNQQPTSFGGGIYGNNNNNNNNNNYNNNQPTSFGGGIYGNNNDYNKNNQQQQPQSFGEGIYGDNKNNNNNNYYNNYNNNNNNNNNYNNNNYNNNNYNNNYNNNNNNYNNNYNNNPPQPQQNSFGGGIYEQPKQNPEEELKNILIEEISAKLSQQLISEKKRLYNQNEKMKNNKSSFSQENKNLQNFINRENEIKAKSEEDMTNMNNALSRIKEQINKEKSTVLNNENCINFIDVPDKASLKIIASETSMEEMVLIVRKAFERKKITFDQAINFTRNSSRDLFAVKYLKEKAINKYKY